MCHVIFNRDDSTYLQTDGRDQCGIVFVSDVHQCREFGNFSIAYGVMKTVKNEDDSYNNLIVEKWEGQSPREIGAGVDELCTL